MIRRLLGPALVLGLSMGGQSALSNTGVIEKACLDTPRGAQSGVICSCIQAVADKVLTTSDQKRGAAFFKDPHKSQEMRQSSNPNDEVFWRKWLDYGDTAAKQCS